MFYFYSDIFSIYYNDNSNHSNTTINVYTLFVATIFVVTFYVSFVERIKIIERYVCFKVIVTAENCKREDKEFWIEKAPDDKTYKLELLAESNRSLLTESDLLQYGFKGGKSLEIPNCHNIELINYIKSVF